MLFRLVEVKALADPGEYLAEAVHADQDFDELHAVAQDRDAEGKAVGAVNAVDADGRNQKPDAEADQRIDQRLSGQRHDRGQAEEHRGEIIRRVEFERRFTHRPGKRHHHGGRHQTGDQRRDECPAERFRRLAALRHGVAVPQHRHVHRLARNAIKNGREAAAIGSGEINRRQKDNRRLDLHLIGERQRQHDTHHQAEPGHDRDRHADQEADEQHQHVERLENLDKAVGKIDEDHAELLVHAHRGHEARRTNGQTVRSRQEAPHRPRA